MLIHIILFPDASEPYGRGNEWATVSKCAKSARKESCDVLLANNVVRKILVAREEAFDADKQKLRVID